MPNRSDQSILIYTIVVMLCLTLWELTFPFNFRIHQEGEWLAETDIHKLNLVSNILLFIPWAILAGVYCWSEGRSSLITVVSVTILGAAVSIFGETVQLFLPGRHSSVVDLLTNSLGSSIGAIIGYGLGSMLHRRFVSLLSWIRCGTHSKRFLWALALIFVVKAAPFNLSVETRYLRLGLQQTWGAGMPLSHAFRWFSQHDADQSFTQVLLEFTRLGLSLSLVGWLTYTACRAARESFIRHSDMSNPSLPVGVVMLILIFGLEVLQWMIQSRIMDSTDLLFGSVGIVAGIIGDFVVGPLRPKVLTTPENAGLMIVWRPKKKRGYEPSP